MSVILLFAGSIGLGFFLIFLIGATSPRPAPVDLKAQSGGSPLVSLDAEQLGKLVAAILGKMGLEIEREAGGRGGFIEIMARNPTPVTGGQILVHVMPAPEQTGKVTGPMVGSFIRAVRSAYVSKGLLFTSGVFTPDARLEAEDTPIELFDRDRLQQMIRDHLGDEAEDALHE